MVDDGLPFELETALERRIAAEPEWREGVEWGQPRPGHPEGAVKHHVAIDVRRTTLLSVHGTFRNGRYRAALNTASGRQYFDAMANTSDRLAGLMDLARDA